MRLYVIGIWLLAAASALAQENAALKVEGAQFRPLRIAVPQAKSNDKAMATTLTDKVRADLTLSGVFQVVNPSSYIGDAFKQPIKWADWTNVGAEGLAVLQTEIEGDKLNAQVSVYQVGAGNSKTFKYQLPARDVRRLAHRMADDIYTFFTGEKGFLSAQIGAIREGNGNMELVLMDIDGTNEKSVTTGRSRNMLPSFSPDGSKIILTNYAMNNPDLCEVRPDGRGFRRISSYPGMNTGGSISPDGTKIAVTLSKSGSQQIYLEDREGKILKQLTSAGDINISPSWSPDGKQIAFVSNRSGNPHIYTMNADGTNQKRLTFQGKYNQQPKYSPDGKYIAMTSRDEENVFDIFLVEVATGKILRVTQDQGRNEDPVFANNRTLVFVSERGGERALYLSTLDGKFQQRLTSGGGYSSPTVGAVR